MEKKTVIKKNKHGKVKVYKPRRRFKRTRVVHYHYRHLPRRGAVIASVHVNARNYRFGGIRYRCYRGFGTSLIVQNGLWFVQHLESG